MSKKDISFFLSLFSSRLGDQILLFLVPLVAFKVTNNASWAGIAFFLETLPRFICFPICGILCDKYSCLKLLKNSQLYRSVTALAFLILLFFNPSFYLLAVFAVISGILSTQGFIARDIMLPYAFSRIRLDRSIANAQLADQVGTILGPLLAGIMLAFMSWNYIILFVILFFVASDIFLKTWVKQTKYVDKRTTDDTIKFVNSFKVSLNILRCSPKIQKIISITFLSNLMLGIVLSSAAVVVTGNLNSSDLFYGILQSFGAAATVLILFSISTFSFEIRWLGLVGYSLMTAGFLLTSFINSYFLYFFGFILLIGFDKMFSVYVRYTRQQLVEGKDLGKASGLIVFLNNISQPIGGLIFGVASIGGLSEIVYVVSFLSILIFAFLWASINTQ